MVNYFMAKPAGSSGKPCQDLLQDPRLSLGEPATLVLLCIRAEEKPMNNFAMERTGFETTSLVP